MRRARVAFVRPSLIEKPIGVLPEKIVSGDDGEQVLTSVDKDDASPMPNKVDNTS